MVNIYEHKAREKEGRGDAHLFIEHPIPLIDVRDVALVFVEAFPREFAFLIDAVDTNNPKLVSRDSGEVRPRPNPGR